MTATVLSAAATCVMSLFLGQAALRLAGAREWSWLAPPVGISVAMLIAAPAMDVPGRCTAMAILLGALTLAAIVWCGRTPAHRPPAAGLLAALPVILLVLVPFLAAGRAGILGVGLNNDMASHMWIADGFLSQAVGDATPLPSDYPFGPHAMVAVIADGLHLGVEHAFAGWSMALPILNAWTALALVRRASWFGRMVTATVVGIPFLIAAYFGQGAFKEVLLAGLVLAVVVLLSGHGPRLGRGRWVPLALVLGGIVSAYSVPGLLWPLVIGGLWAVGEAGLWIVRRGTGGLASAARREMPSIGIGVAVFVICLLPQVPRIERFVSNRGTGGVAKDDIGNLFGPIPGWEAFGVWNNPDFRLPASPAFTGGMWTAFVVGLVLFGAVWALRRGRWMLPLAAGASMLIWWATSDSQSPYVAAKALVIASPLLLLVAVLPLVERGPRRPLPWLLAPVLALALLGRVGLSDVQALRASPVGPTDHASQLRSFRPLIEGRPTLFLGNDEFIVWELSGSRVKWAAVAATPEVPFRPGKDWDYGEPIDFDSVRARTLNRYEWIVGPRDAASSAPPPQLRLARSTEDYRLWRRVGRVEEHSILGEGEWPGAFLRCRAGDRSIALAGEVAAVRRAPLVVPLAPAAAGATVSTRIDLPRGRWELQTPYTSPLPVEVTAPGLSTTLSPNLDRPGPRLPIGRVEVRRREPLSISFHVENTALSPPTAAASFNLVVATPVGNPVRIVPIREACGKYVDWYR